MEEWQFILHFQFSISNSNNSNPNNLFIMNANNKSFALPLTFIGIMFFAIGFALGINSLLVPVLQGSLGISNAASYLIIAATFIPFLVFGYPAGLTIKAIGYKRTMSLSFIIFAVAFYLFIHCCPKKIS